VNFEISTSQLFDLIIDPHFAFSRDEMKSNNLKKMDFAN